MKKAWEIISSVFVWIIVAITVAMMVFTIVSVNTFDRNDRQLFGFRFYIVLSDSMSATDFDAGDVVLVKEVDPTTLQEGDIIAYTSQNSENYGETVTHKIRRLTTDANGNPGFITYGTTTNTDDETVVTYPFILGQYKLHVPKIGTFFQFLKTPQGYFVCILIPFLLLIIYQGLNCVRLFRLYKKEQMDELQAEKDAIEAQRKQSEAMMAELLAMKAQMAAGAVPVAAPQPAAAEPVAVAEPAVTQTTEVESEVAEQEAQPDVAAMMAELQALRAQLANATAAQAQQSSEKTDDFEIIDLD